MTGIHQTIKRGDTYKLLAACFYEPDKGLMLEERVCRNLAGLLAATAPLAVPSAELMDKALNDLNQHRLSIDHAALFIGPFELIAAPYASVWIEQQRVVMTDSTMDVQRYYKDAGLSLDVSEPPDHIAIMLEFMYYLCQQETAAGPESNDEEAQRCRKLQHDFFSKALLPWIYKFCDALERKSGNIFYQSLGTTLKGFVESEQDLLTE